MVKRLLIVVLGKGNSGKSTTWNTLFGRRVKTGYQKLYLNEAQWVDGVFLIYSSPGERKVPVKKILRRKRPDIILCSIQYTDSVESFDFFFSQGYEVFVQWLNPGYKDKRKYEDNHCLQEYLINKGAFISKRNGKLLPRQRVSEIRKIILGWSVYDNLLRTDFKLKNKIFSRS